MSDPPPIKQQQQPQPCPPGGMTVEEYRVRAKEMVDYISSYLETIRDRRVFPDVSPGYMSKLVPDACPDKPEAWEDIMADVERVVMPGITHWQSPHNHAYFPALNSFPSLIGDMLADAINCIGFTWASSPAATELETIVMDWLGKMIGLPPPFLHGNRTQKGLGGGCIQTTASDCTFVTLLAARTDAIRRFKVTAPDVDDAEINGRLIAYCSDQAHSSVEKAGLIGLVKLRFLPSDENLSLRGDTLQEAIYRDREMGFIPFYVCATLGTTGACAFDNLKEIGPVCQSENIWLHIDAAYAGSAFICPEFRYLMAGIEHANSFAFNPSKWLMVHFDCSAMWVKDATALHRTFNVEPLYLQHENSGAAIDYMHWQIALSRKFRSLKLWFVLRSFGVEGIQSHIRKGVERSIHFEKLVRSDRRFEVSARRYLGMVVFRMAGPNQLTESLLKRLNKQGEIHMVPASLQGKYVIRFTVTSQYTTLDDIERDWRMITEMATKILTEARTTTTEESILENEEEEEVNDVEFDEDEETYNGVADDGDEETFFHNDIKKDLEREENGEFETILAARGNYVAKLETKKNGASENDRRGSKNNTTVVLNNGKENINDEAIRNGNDDNDVNNDDDDNDERNRKMKKGANSGQKSTSISTGGNNLAESRDKSEVLFSEEFSTNPNLDAEACSSSYPPSKAAMLPPSGSAGVGNLGDRKKSPAANLKILNAKTAAAKRRDYGLSLLLSNVPMSPKIVNGSFAALFDGCDGSSDMTSLTRKLGMDGEFIRLSPRKRGKLADAEKQLSLDYGVLTASHKLCPTRMKIMGSLDSKIDDILELSTALKGQKGNEKKGNGQGGGSEGKTREECVNGEKDGESGMTGSVKREREREEGKIGRPIKEIDGVVRGNDSKEFGNGVNELVTSIEDGGNGRVAEKENWDTGHKMEDDIDDVNDEKRKPEFVVKVEREEQRGQQHSVCPLCGRGGM